MLNFELESDAQTLGEVSVVARKNLEGERALQMERRKATLAIENIGSKEMSIKGISNVDVYKRQLMTIRYKVFAPMAVQWQEVLYWVIIASITLANLFALRQENLKRLMAFSSISQAGYIMLGVISGTSLGMTSLVYYVLIYLFANLAVFTVITIVALRADKFTLEDYNGLYTTNPKPVCLLYTSARKSKKPSTT